MADLIKKIKIKKQDGTFTDYIPIGAEAKNINAEDGESVELKLNKKPYYFNNIIDMKTDLKLKNGDYVITLGYYEVNDGGGATYKITNTTSLTEYQEELDNDLYATLIIKNDTVNILQFGAKGNAVNDDTTSIQNALKCRGNDYIKILFPSNKVFIAKDKLFIYSNTHINLNGSTIKDASDIVVSTSVNNLQFLNNYESMYSEGYGALKNFKIENGTLDGNTGGVMFCLFHGENLVFDNLYFKDAFVSTHVFDMGGCKDVTIKKCNFIGNLLSESQNKYREVIQPDYASYVGLPYWGNEEGYAFDLLPCINITIDECVFKKKTNDAYFLNAIGSHYINTTAHENIIIKNCEFYDFEYSSIRLPRVKNLKILSNKFYNISETRTGDNPFITLENMESQVDEKISKENIEIGKNEFINVGDVVDAIFINIDGDSEYLTKNIYIYENNYVGKLIEDSPFSATSVAGQDFSHLNNCENIYLQNNIIEQTKSIIFRNDNKILKNINMENNTFIKCLRAIRGADSTTLEDDNIDGLIYQNNIWKNSNGELNTSSFVIEGEFDNNSAVTSDKYIVPSSFSKDMIRIATNNLHDLVLPYYIKNAILRGYISFLPTVSGEYILRVRVYDTNTQEFVMDESNEYSVTANEIIKMELPTLIFEEYSLRHNRFGMYNGHYLVSITTTLPEGTQILQSNPTNNRASKIILEGF